MISCWFKLIEWKKRPFSDFAEHIFSLFLNSYYSIKVVWSFRWFSLHVSIGDLYRSVHRDVYCLCDVAGACVRVQSGYQLPAFETYCKQAHWFNCCSWSWSVLKVAQWLHTPFCHKTNVLDEHWCMPKTLNITCLAVMFSMKVGHSMLYICSLETLMAELINKFLYFWVVLSKTQNAAFHL